MTDTVPQSPIALRTTRLDDISVSGFECHPMSAPVSAMALAAEAGSLEHGCETNPPPPITPLPTWPQLGPLPAREGLWMQAMQIYNKREPWTRGDPELEFHVEFIRPNTLVYDSTFIGNTRLDPMPKPTPVACSGRLAHDQVRQFDFNGEHGATYIQDVLLWSPVEDRRDETVFFPFGGVAGTRTTPLQGPMKLILTERDDGGECPKPTKEGVGGGFGIGVEISFNSSSGYYKWKPKGKLKDLLADLGFYNENDPLGEWTFSSYDVVANLRRHKLGDAWADVYVSSNLPVTGFWVRPNWLLF